MLSEFEGSNTIYRDSFCGDHWPAVYIDLLEQLKAMYPAEKNLFIKYGCTVFGQLRIGKR